MYYLVKQKLDEYYDLLVFEHYQKPIEYLIR